MPENRGEAQVSADAPGVDRAPYVQRQDIALGQLFNLAQDMLCIAGFDGCFKQVNPVWTRTLGWTAEELTSRPFADFIHPDDRDKTAAEVGTLVDGAETLHFENRYRCRDGSYRWLSWTSSPSASEQLIYAAARDVTVARHREQMAAARLAVTTIVSEAADWDDAGKRILESVCTSLGWSIGALWIVDPSGDNLVWRSAHFGNDSARERYAASVGVDTRVRGESLEGLVWERGEPVLSDDVYGGVRLDLPARAGGVATMGGGFAFPIRSAGEVTGVMAFGSDDVQLVEVDLRSEAEGLADRIEVLLDRLAATERMQHLAFHDSLTGLPNLTLFRERAEQALRVAARAGTFVGIVVADVDHFKQVNDTFGHAAGDDVLVHVGTQLAGCLRASDTVARLGGDEFGVVLPTTTAEGIEAATAKIMEALAAPISVQGVQLPVRVSFGCAMSSGALQSYDDLLRDADSAMYRDKASRAII